MKKIINSKTTPCFIWFMFWAIKIFNEVGEPARITREVSPNDFFMSLFCIAIIPMALGFHAGINQTKNK